MEPIIDSFISPDHGRTRIYFAPTSWCPPMLRAHLDGNLETVSTKRLDLADLEQHMWGCDAPYEKRLTTVGGAEIRARGRSAVVLAVWLADLITEDRTQSQQARCSKPAPAVNPPGPAVPATGPSGPGRQIPI